MLIIVIGILIFSFFKIDLQAVMENPQAKKNVAYVGSLVQKLWGDYFQKPLNSIIKNNLNNINNFGGVGGELKSKTENKLPQPKKINN
ncbi:MAG: hypothetical protein WC795_00770 [Candidatus Paceibacterota bacterium]